MPRRPSSPSPTTWKALSVSIPCRAGPTRVEQAYRLLLQPPASQRTAAAAQAAPQDTQ
jgi:hypothetical protein